MRAYSLDLRKKIVESVKKGVPKAETARRFGVDRATVKRYCKQFDERGTLEPSKAPGKRPKLGQKASKLLVEDLERRPWATHSQRAEFLFAVSGVSVSEATVCRAVGTLRRSRKKIQGGGRKRRVLEKPMAHGGRQHRSFWPGVRGRDGHPHLLGSHLRLRARRREGLLRDPEKPRQEHDAPYEHRCGRDGAFDGRGRGHDRPCVRDLRGAGAGPRSTSGTDRGNGQARSAPAKEDKGAHRGEGLRAHLPTVLLPGPQSHRGSLLEDKAHPQEGRRPHQGGPDRGDGSSIGGRECRRRAGIPRSLRLPPPGAATMKGAVSTLAATSSEFYRRRGRSSHLQRPSKSVLVLSLRGSLASAWESRRPHLGTR